MEEHPLAKVPEERWVFYQPSMSLQASCQIVPRSPGEEPTTVRINSNHTCREGTLSRIRGCFREHLIFKEPIGAKPWEVKLVPGADPNLDYEKPSIAPKTFLSVHNVGPPGNRDESADPEELIQVADLLVGIPCLLLRPNRKPGDWWISTKPANLATGKYVYWNGTDNFFLRHPALAAVVLGLYRQAFLLCAQGYGPQVLGTVPRKHVEKALTESDWKLAYGIANQVRTWIEVPPGESGSYQNYAFPLLSPEGKKHPLSYWQRFMRLQRAVRRHGYDAVLEQDFFKSWNLLGKGTGFTGAWQFWGGRGHLTARHKKIMELGKPLKRSKVNGKEAAKTDSGN